jgi:nucleotide-binding universal stress UspA family protein
MTVGPEAHLPVGTGDQQQVVLHATALREASRPSAALACRIAASRNARLVLLHVLPPKDEMEREGLPTGLDSAALYELRTLAAEMGLDCSSSVQARVVHGNPSIEILAEASELHANLIVLGYIERSVFENLTRERTIFHVLAHAHCPVLTLLEPLVKEGVLETRRLTLHQG